MSYKGHDLDLRPQCAGPPREETIRAMPLPSREPIAVDQATLDCCNAAFDLARAHGAREVRLEHLLHALTRVPAASGLLEEAGIRADQLRRAATLAMADEAPGLAQDIAGAPVASAPFEDVLRRASAEADMRRSPATLQDLLRALLESPAAMPLQGASDPQLLARWREETSRPCPSTAAADRLAELTPAAGDAVLARLGALETAIQSLEARLGGASAIEAKLDELGRAVAALAERPAPSNAESHVADAMLASQVAERMAHAETGLLALQEQAEHHWAAAKERQDAIESSLRTQAAKIEQARKSQEQAVGDIHDALLKLGADQHVLGDSFAAWRSETGGDLSIISSRLEQLDRAALDMLEQLSLELRMRPRLNGLDGTRLRANLKRVLHNTGSVLTSGWRKEAPTYAAHAHDDADPPAAEDRAHLPRA